VPARSAWSRRGVWPVIRSAGGSHCARRSGSPRRSPPSRCSTSRRVLSRRAARSRACSTYCRAEARARLVGDGLSPALAEWLLLNLESGDGGYHWKIDRRALAALHTRIAAEDLWPAVEGPRDYRVQCVRGGASGYVSDADAWRLQAGGCPVVTVDGAGHFLHAERPEAVADAVLAFLA